MGSNKFQSTLRKFTVFLYLTAALKNVYLYHTQTLMPYVPVSHTHTHALCTCITHTLMPYVPVSHTHSCPMYLYHTHSCPMYLYHTHTHTLMPYVPVSHTHTHALCTCITHTHTHALCITHTHALCMPRRHVNEAEMYLHTFLNSSLEGVVSITTRQLYPR